MATYAELWDLQADANLQKRVSWALCVAAAGIYAEAPGTDERRAWARKAFTGGIVTPMRHIMLRVLSNTTIAAAGASCTDPDLQYQVGQILNELVALG